MQAPLRPQALPLTRSTEHRGDASFPHGEQRDASPPEQVKTGSVLEQETSSPGLLVFRGWEESGEPAFSQRSRESFPKSLRWLRDKVSLIPNFPGLLQFFINVYFV